MKIIIVIIIIIIMINLHDFRIFRFPKRTKELLCIRIVTDVIGFPTMTKHSYTHRVFCYRIISHIG
jgi:hypothetical protein